MADLLSPGVLTQETDLTITAPAVATSTGAFAGNFAWGPTNEIYQVSNEANLVNVFGKPNNDNFASFFSAKNFLDYATNLMLVRAETSTQLNAVANGSAVNIGNSTTYNASFADGQASVGGFAAKYPGVLGNSLKVSMADASSYTKTLSGTIAVAASANTLTGTDTHFTTELAVGSYVVMTVGSVAVTATVTEIISDTLANVDVNYSSTQDGITAVAHWEFYSYFATAPVDSNQALAVGATGDGLHIVVVDEDGVISGTSGTILEMFDNVSKARNALKFDGTSGYYKNVLNNSKYVWWMDHPESNAVSTVGSDFGDAVVAGAFKDLLAPITSSLSGGVDGDVASDGELMTAYDLFKNTEQVSVSLIFTGNVSTDISRYVVQNVAELRQDSIAFISPNDAGAPIIGNTSTSLTSIISWYNTVNLNSSYGVADTGFKYQYDKYNDVYRWIPLNADIAGLCARTDSVAEAWYSPAGLNRGQIKNVTRLAYNPDKAARDELFKRNINPVVSFPGEGTLLYGDKTTMRRPSAFDEIGVRRLFIGLETSIAIASRSFLFEQNTDLTRKLFAGMITPKLRDVKGRQGITDFYVDIGPNVNTPDTIDAGELRANIFIKPVHSIRFIKLNFVATRTGASFTEIQL